MARAKRSASDGTEQKAPRRSQRNSRLYPGRATSLADLAEEIKLLRGLVKDAVDANQVEETRRLVLALCNALRLQQTLAGQPASEGRDLIDELLDQVARDKQAATESTE